ncbi:MAG: alpha/beta hydrolase [Sphingomonadales bacterium]
MNRLLLFFTSLLISTVSVSQPCDYTQKKYAIRQELNTVYGVAKAYGNRQDTLYIDIYKPVGDKNRFRPMILFIHGGGFSGGNYKDVTNPAKSFAQRGYVAATASYRLGFFRPVFPDQYPWALDKAEPERAAYRALQDIKGAVRYLKGRNMADSADILNFFIGGFSAGAITSLNVAFVNDNKFRPASCDSINSVVYQGNNYKRPALGGVEGTLNLNGYNTSVRGVLNYFGAVADTAVLESARPAVFNYHQLGDPVVPAGINRPFYGLGLGMSDNWPMLYGSTIISRRLKALGYTGIAMRNRIINGNVHDVDNPALMDTMTANWASAVICSPNTGTRKTLQEKPYQLQTEGSKTFLYPLQSGIWEFYDMAGRMLNKLNIVAGQRIEITHTPCLIRYKTNLVEGSFLCNP